MLGLKLNWDEEQEKVALNHKLLGQVIYRMSPFLGSIEASLAGAGIKAQMVPKILNHSSIDSALLNGVPLV